MELSEEQFCAVAHKEQGTTKIFGKQLSREGIEREREKERTKRREGKKARSHSLAWRGRFVPFKMTWEPDIMLYILRGWCHDIFGSL